MFYFKSILWDEQHRESLAHELVESEGHSLRVQSDNNCCADNNRLVPWTRKQHFLRTPGLKWSRRELSLVLLSDCFTMVYYGSLYCAHICYAIWYCIRQVIGEKSGVNVLCRKFKAISFVWALALYLNRHVHHRCTPWWDNMAKSGHGFQTASVHQAECVIQTPVSRPS